MKAMSTETIEKHLEDLKKKRPKWMYERQIIELEAWLEYQKGCEERDKKELLNCLKCNNYQVNSIYVPFESEADDECKIDHEKFAEYFPGETQDLECDGFKPFEHRKIEEKK